jgi:hypothetical protein
MLTVIAAALVALVAFEAGWIGRGREEAGRWQYAPLRYGPLGNFLLRFDTATGKLERVRFPASDVAWEEVGVLPPGKEPVPDPLRSQLGPPGAGAGGLAPGAGAGLAPGPGGGLARGIPAAPAAPSASAAGAPASPQGAPAPGASPAKPPGAPPGKAP